MSQSCTHTRGSQEREEGDHSPDRDAGRGSPIGMERLAVGVAVAAACRSTAAFVLTPHTPRVQLSTSGGTKFVQPDPIRYNAICVCDICACLAAVHKCACAGRALASTPPLSLSMCVPHGQLPLSVVRETAPTSAFFLESWQHDLGLAHDFAELFCVYLHKQARSTLLTAVCSMPEGARQERERPYSSR